MEAGGHSCWETVVNITRDELLQLIGDQQTQQFVTEAVGDIVRAALGLRAFESDGRGDVSVEIEEDLSLECISSAVSERCVTHLMSRLMCGEGVEQKAALI